MKNSRLTWGLLAVVAVVWGFILLRIVRTLADNHDEPVLTLADTGKLSPNEPQKDTFSLLSHYRDPFLTSLKQTEVPDKPRLFQESQSGKIPKATMPLPVLVLPLDSVAQYMGLIHNGASGKKVALVKLGGRECLMSEGQTVEGIRLMEQRKDSLKLVYRHQIKWLRRTP
jgi:hypothetical protein